MPIPILMYHQIDKPAGRGSPFRYLTVDPANFHRQMKWLKRMGYAGLSMRDLQPYLGNAVDAFCYPYGDFSREVRQMVEEAGYTTATTTQRGRATPQHDMLLLPRKIVRRTDGWLNVLRKSVTG